jgi:hypothetical protein
MEPNTFTEQLEFLKQLDEYITTKAKERVNSLPVDAYDSEDTKDIATALAKAQGEFPRIGHNRENPFFKASYADLDSIIRAVRPALSKNGLSITQQQILNSDGMTILATRLRHVSGQWIETRARILPPKNDPQSYASTLTYMKRYSFMSLLCITISDDDYDDDAEKSMHEVRGGMSKGVALNTKYNPKEVSPEAITKEQLDELHYELAEYPDIAEMVLDGLKIQNLADMPKTKFQVSCNRIREIKNLRNGIK